MSKDMSLYIHIPFCVRKCLYCDFLSFSADEDTVKDYFRALNKEIEETLAEYREYSVRSVFFGGGTPSYPPAEYLCDSLSMILEGFKIAPDAEISLELNPGTADLDRIKKYREAGFNRLSIGAQSFDDLELKRLGRIHNVFDIVETFDGAREAGFDNINLDIMSALPGQSSKSYKKTLQSVMTLRPEHVSAYSLIVEEGTPFYDMELDLPDEDTDRDMYHDTKTVLEENGYHRYEISNYALGNQEDERLECFHNKVYWERGNYLGLGLGAASMMNEVRWNNTSLMDEYLVGAMKNNVKILTENEQMEEFMFLGLRMVKGVSVDRFKELFSKDIMQVFGSVIEKYEKMGLLEVSDRIKLTEKGLDVSNTVMADFLF
ncbi:MAG: radical SAM family heme chaperone HemW [Butyrivibrio sp.]|nr:radical SAM family heme chaperone HemW [Butyrivibrio sp.]